ncbi:MAG TPA: serine hydrolase domain-containing protein [Gemmatimonadaceae bacterium]|nr:serine hydrolase domain-containing protein [Gemmatimonadaceae bacterium]
MIHRIAVAASAVALVLVSGWTTSAAPFFELRLASDKPAAGFTRMEMPSRDAIYVSSSVAVSDEHVEAMALEASRLNRSTLAVTWTAAGAAAYSSFLKDNPGPLLVVLLEGRPVASARIFPPSPRAEVPRFHVTIGIDVPESDVPRLQREIARRWPDAPAKQGASVSRRLRPAVRIENRPDTAFDILDRMRYYHVPGVSIAVVDGHRIVYASGFGVTEFGGSKLVDTTTLFLAGSISKPVFATGALKLVEQGKLSLDDDVNRTLKSWRLPDSRFTATEKVTLRRLLTHSAGLTVWGFPGYRTDAAIPTVQQVLDGASPANTQPVRNDTTPGARWLYSGGGITIAQLMATDATGESFPALMKRLVLDPAGMAHSTFENPLPKSRDASAASGHERFDTPVTGRYHVYPEMAAAGLWTTAPDLARWALALTRAYNGDRNVLVSPETARQMLSKQVQQRPPFGSGHWGLGVGVGGEGDSVFFQHGGRDEGFVASSIMWPKLGRGLFVLTNGVSGALLAEINRAFADVFGHGAGPRTVKRVAAADSASLAPLAGTYEFVSPNLRDTVRLDVKAAPGMLRMWDYSLQRMRYLLPDDGGGFFDFDIGSQFAVEREGSQPAGRVTGLVLVQGTNRRVARRVAP